LSYDEIENTITNGSFAFVVKIKNEIYVIKTFFDHYKYYTAVKKNIYERIGYHRFILRYYEQADVIFKEGRFLDLILQYHRIEIFKDLFSNPDYADAKSE
jgi:hypothetical protein